MSHPNPRETPEFLSSPPVTVVVVDDDPILVALLEEMLAAVGYAVEGFTDPAAALVRLRRGPVPDLAIVDCIMPGLSGAELCAALAADGVGVPVLLMTALADPSFAVHPEWASVLNKPFLEEDLLAEIEAQIRPRSGPRTRHDLLPGTPGNRARA
jgi:two-component system OmpR family response regulator